MRDLIVTDLSWERDPHLNVSLDEAIHCNIEDAAVLRFWHNANAVVIGRYQCPLAEVNYALCFRLGTMIVRRHTGGGAVYHDMGNLNISLVLPKKNSSLDDFQSSRARFITGIISALRSIAAEPYFSSESSIWIADGHKLCGIAASINRVAYLIHASLIVSSDPARVTSILASDYKTPTGVVPSHRSKVTNIETLAAHSIQMNNIEQAVTRQLEVAFGLEKSCSSLTGSILDAARKLADLKYRKTAWLFEPCIAQRAECTQGTAHDLVGDLLFENVNALFVRPCP